MTTRRTTSLDNSFTRPVLAPRLPETVVWIVSVVAIVAGMVTLVGWFINARPLTDWWDDGISMFANTALCFVLCGAALLFAIDPEPRWRRRMARLFSGTAAVIGGLSLLEHLIGVNLGLDTLVVERDWGQKAATAPMRMGPPAATSFLILGIAIYGTTLSQYARRNAAALAVVPLVIASLSVIGYLLGADLLFGVPRVTGIARQTGILLFLVAIGVIAAVPEHGLMAALRRPDIGGVLIRQLIVPLIFLPILLGWARVAGEKAGFYDTAFGTSVLILLQVAFLVALLWWTSRSLSRYVKQAQDASLRLAAIVESSHDAVIGKSLDGTIKSWNEGATELYGYSADEAIGQNVAMLIPADRIDEEDQIQSRLQNGERVDAYETIRLRKDGIPVHVSLSVSPIRDADGQIIGASKIARDITHRIQADEAMRRSEAELQTMANSIPQLAWMATPNGYIFWYNQQWYDYTGTSYDDMAGWGWQSVHHPDSLPNVLERWNQCIEKGEPFEMEFPLRAASGEFRWFLTRAQPLRDAKGTTLRWFGTNTDVDDVKRNEQALQQKTTTLKLLNDAGKILSAQLQLDELVQSVTDVATALSTAEFGAFFYNTTDESGGRYLLYALSGASREQFEKFGMPRPTTLFGPTFAGQGTIRSGDIANDPRYGKMAPHHGMPEGHLPVRSYLAVPVVSRMGEVIGGLFFGHSEPNRFTEGTERVIEGIAAQAGVAIDNARLYENLKRAADEREKLLEAERSARGEAERLNVMKDEFLATLSHELRTPLNAILGWAQILGMGDSDEDDLREGLETIERNARAQTQLIEDLLDMSRIVSGKVRLDMQIVDVQDILRQAVESVRPSADAKQIHLMLDLDAHPARISGDGVRLQQVFWNLLTNAIKFTSRGGEVAVACRHRDTDLEISVRDSGIGIAPDVLDHVFERFRQADSSTTRVFGGLGLGLSIVKNLVEMHGGTVHAESPGKDQGATFTLRVPRTPTIEPWGESANGTLHGLVDVEPNELAGIRVLVVDDESDARHLVQRMLAQYEAQVDTATGADEALALLRNGGVPDVIVSDIGMPGMDGYEFIRRVRQLPSDKGGELPAIALTAFARSEDRRRAIDAGYQLHVAKPIEGRQLAASITSLLTNIN